MKKVLIVLTVVGAGIVTGTERDDCPGKKVCPLTGQLVCVDRCPQAK